MFLLAPMKEAVAKHLATFKDYPQRQGGGSFMPSAD